MLVSFQTIEMHSYLRSSNSAYQMTSGDTPKTRILSSTAVITLTSHYYFSKSNFLLLLLVAARTYVCFTVGNGILSTTIYS